jgi:hypothetical protein
MAVVKNVYDLQQVQDDSRNLVIVMDVVEMEQRREHPKRD